MKRNIFRLLFTAALLFSFKVNALNDNNIYTSDEIPKSSYVIGTNLFTKPDNVIFNTVDNPNAIYDNGTLYYKAIMFGATTIYSNDADDMIIYYKNFAGTWKNGVSGVSFGESEVPETFYINYVNGICVDSNGCSNPGTYDKATFKYTNFEGEIVTSTVSFADGATVAKPADPVRLGSEFVCWTEYDEETNPEDRDCYEFDEATTSGTIFEAKFNKVSYTIKYDLNGGTVNGTEIADQICDFDSILSTNECNLNTATPNKDGYVFMGWSTTNDFEDNSVVVTDANLKDALVNATGATVTLHAIWKPAEYTITYDLNGGDEFTGYVAARYTILDNITLTTPTSTPTRIGYKFDGWYENGITKVTSINGRTGNITLIAHWKEVPITIIYKDANDQSIAGFDNLSCTHEKCTISKTIPTDANNFAFKYWLGSDGNYYKSGAVIKGLTSNLTLKAIFENSASYKITFDTNSGDSLASNVISEYVSSVGANLPVPTRTGYTFTGWVKNGDTTDTKYFEIEKNTTGNLALTATWTKNTYSYGVYFNDGTTLDSLDNLEYGATVTLPSISEAETKINDRFYTLSAWYEINSKQTIPVVDEAGNPITVNVTINSNKVYIPIWNVSRTYNYVFDVNGGEGNNTTGTYNYGSESSITVPTATRVGYTFAGWEEVNGSATIASNNVSVTDSKYGNLYFKAKWTANNYTVTFENGEGTTLSTKNCQYDDSNCTIDVADPTKDGVSFLYWKVKNDTTNANIYTKNSTIKVTGNVTLIPEWSSKTMYTITYDLDGGKLEGTYATSVNYGENVTLPSTGITKDGYTFDYWSVTNGSATINGNTLTNVTSNVVVKALYKAKTVKIEYEDEDDTSLGSDTEFYDSQTKTAFTYNGTSLKVFAYWEGSNGYVYAPGEEILLGSYTPTLTLTPVFLNDAIYNSDIHTITYNLNGGTTTGELIGKYVDDDTFDLADITRENYTFDGWTTDEEGTQFVTDASQLTGDVTLYAQWSPITYTMTYNDGTSIIIEEATAGELYYTAYGSDYTSTFRYWVDDEGITYEAWEAMMPTSNINFYASYVSNNASENHAITYNYPDRWPVGDRVPNAYTEGESFALPVLGDYGTYKFAGWAVGPSSSDTIITSVTSQDTDLNLYPVWNDNSGGLYYPLITELY